MRGGSPETWEIESPRPTSPDEGALNPVAVIFPLPGGREVTASGWVPAVAAPAPTGLALATSTAERRRWYARRLSARSVDRSHGNPPANSVASGQTPELARPELVRPDGTTEDTPLDPQIGLP